jgi:hypothetical protein
MTRLNSATQRGKAAELRAMAWLIEGGWEVMLPASDDTRVDIVYRKVTGAGIHGPWRSAQVKRCYDKKGHPTVNVVRSNGERYQPIDADWLVAVSENRMWFLPFHEVCHLSRLRLTAKHNKYLKVGEPL